MVGGHRQDHVGHHLDGGLLLPTERVAPRAEELGRVAVRKAQRGARECDIVGRVRGGQLQLILLSGQVVDRDHRDLAPVRELGPLWSGEEGDRPEDTTAVDLEDLGARHGGEHDARLSGPTVGDVLHVVGHRDRVHEVVSHHLPFELPVARVGPAVAVLDVVHGHHLVAPADHHLRGARACARRARQAQQGGVGVQQVGGRERRATARASHRTVAWPSGTHRTAQHGGKSSGFGGRGRSSRRHSLPRQRGRARGRAHIRRVRRYRPHRHDPSV